MKVVVDTNVLISAFIATGSCKDVLEYAVESHEVIISPYILRELGEKLRGKLGFSEQDYREIRDLLLEHVLIVRESEEYRPQCSDKKDIPLLQLCLTVNADILITGDAQIRRLKRIGNTRIISPREFWKIEKDFL